MPDENRSSRRRRTSLISSESSLAGDSDGPGTDDFGGVNPTAPSSAVNTNSTKLLEDFFFII